MASVHQLNTHRRDKALKVIKKDLENIIPTLETIIKSFNNYRHYIPVSSIIKNVTDNKSILEIHLNKIKDTLKEGSSDGEK